MSRYVMVIAKEYDRDDEKHVRMLYQNTRRVHDDADNHMQQQLQGVIDEMACFLTNSHHYQSFMYLQGLVQFLHKLKYDLSDLYMNGMKSSNDMITYDIRFLSNPCDSIVCDVISSDMASDMINDAVCS